MIRFKTETPEEAKAAAEKAARVVKKAEKAGGPHEGAEAGASDEAEAEATHGKKKGAAGRAAKKK